jgi:hypothetical protein
VRAHKQAGHMGASDLIKALQKHLARRGPSTYGKSALAVAADVEEGQHQNDDTTYRREPFAAAESR